jgi:hypothetical protein
MAVGRDRRRQSRTRKKNSYLGKMFLSRRIWGGQLSKQIEENKSIAFLGLECFIGKVIIERSSQEGLPSFVPLLLSFNNVLNKNDWYSVAMNEGNQEQKSWGDVVPKFINTKGKIKMVWWLQKFVVLLLHF